MLSDRLLRELPGGAEVADELLRKVAPVGKTILFDVEALYVENVDTSSCEALISVLSEPDRVRSAQAGVGFMFRDYDDRGEFIFLVPEVRRFVRALHEKIEHLFYFIAPDPMLAQFVEFAAAFSPDDGFVRVGQSMSVQMGDEVLDALFERLAAVWQFADLVGDDAERVVRSVAAQGGFPEDAVKDLVRIAAASAAGLEANAEPDGRRP